jgi:hypothetical protein
MWSKNELNCDRIILLDLDGGRGTDAESERYDTLLGGNWISPKRGYTDKRCLREPGCGLGGS